MATYYWVGGSGTWNSSSTTNWAASSGGAGGAGAPNSTDTVIFDANSGTGTCTTASGSACATATLNSANLGLTLGANHTMSGLFTLTLGVLALGSYSLICSRFSSSNSNTRSILFGTGNITLTGNNATIWTTATATGFTYTGTSTVNCTYSGAVGTRTIFGGNPTVPLSFNISAGTDIVSIGGNASYLNINFTGFSGTLSAASAVRSINGNLTFSSGMTISAETGGFQFVSSSGTQQVTSNGKTLDCPLTVNATGATVAFQDALTQGSTRNFTLTNGTVQFKNGVTSTVGNFLTSGTNQKFLQSTTPGSQATLSEAAGAVDVSYLTIRDINATGGATWNAYVNQQNVDAGNNDGWDFGISPIVGSYEYTYQLRSFTQPRRF